MKSFTTLLLALLVSLFAMSNVAQAQSVAGEWDGLMNTPGGARPMKIVFKQEGEKLTGVVKREAGDAPLTGTIKGNKIEFSYTVNYNGNAMVLTMTTTVTGNEMKGVVSFGGQAEEEFTAKRAAAPSGALNDAATQSDRLTATR
jgi:hypothetical protein